MAKFKYTALRPSGEEVSGRIKDESERNVREALIAQGLAPITIKEARSLNIEITKSKVKRKTLMHFTRQLAVFTRAGVNLTTALDTISRDSNDSTLKRTCREIGEDLRNGQRFSESASKHINNVFPKYYIGVLQSAESTGQLDVALDILVEYLEREIETRSKLAGALTYPLIVLGLSFVTIGLLAGFVLPKFVTIFETFNTELPLPTKMLLFIAKFFGEWWYFTSGVGAVVGALVIYLSSRYGRSLRTRILARTPLIKGIVLYSNLERFTSIMYTMLTVGVSVPRAMEITVNSLTNPAYQRRFDEARSSMIEGGGFAAPLIATDLFPSAAKQMIRVGEDTGTLDQQMGFAAKYFSKELEYKIRRVTSFFEPALIVFVGLMVGFVAIAMVSAIYGSISGLEGG